MAIPALAAVSPQVRAEFLPLWASTITFVLYAYKYHSVQKECIQLFGGSLLAHIRKFCLARVKRGDHWLITLRGARTADCSPVLSGDSVDSAFKIDCDDDDARRAMEDFLRETLQSRCALYLTSDDFYELSNIYFGVFPLGTTALTNAWDVQVNRVQPLA